MKKVLVSLFMVVLLLTGCSTETQEDTTGLTGDINIAGSSTVYPITSEIAYWFTDENPNVTINIESTGTGGGFELFDVGETDINNASRAINEDEKAIASENGVEYTELLLGTDGITIVVNPENDWMSDVTVDELKQIFNADSSVTNWSDIRSDWPEEKINLYGPTSASGTYDFFCEEIIDEEQCAIRGDMNGTENDNEIISNVANDKYGIGFLGFAYYQENSDSVNDVAIEGVYPEIETIKNGEYYLSRPLYIYVNNDAMQTNEALNEFVSYYMGDEVAQHVEESGYVALEESEYDEQRAKL